MRKSSSWISGFALALLLAFTLPAQAGEENVIARHLFKEAESAVERADYETALGKLSYAEKESGGSADHLYLRIMARNGLLKSQTTLDFNNLEHLREDVAAYLNSYGGAAEMRKSVAEVTRISASLKSYPDRPASWQAIIEPLLKQGRYHESLAMLSKAEAAEGKLDEPLHYLKLTALHHVVVLDEFFANADRARELEREIRAYLDAHGKSPNNEGHAQHAARMAKGLAGLEDYLKAKHLHNDRKDYAQAFEYHAKAAKQGSPMGMRALAMLYRGGLGVAKNGALSRRWYERAVENGCYMAMQNLGEFYYYGDGVPRDYAAARQWFEKGAQQGFRVSMHYLGEIYHYGRGVKEDHQKALNWYEKAGRLGYAKSLWAIGLMHHKRVGVERDDEAAKMWYEKAAERGSAAAMNNLGSMETDDAIAIAWYRKAAEKGNSDAMVNLGYRYEDGVGKDFAVARTWYEKGGEAGSAEGMLSMAELYMWGRGVPVDYVKAGKWYEKAANLGNRKAMHVLSQMYEKGDGVSQDMKKAQEWREKAYAR